MARRKDFLGTTALAAAAGLMAAPALAGTLPVLPMIDSGGGGYVYIDLDEGTVPPGLHAVTDKVNEKLVWTGSQGGKLGNCVRASVPDPGNDATGGWAICDTGHHSGKRIKLELTGKGPTDIRFNTEDSGGITEYYYYGKTWNKSGARILGFEVQLGTGTGDNFVAMDQSDPDTSVLFDDDSQSRFRLPDGLFGAGGQGEGKPLGVGFFSDSDIIVDNLAPGPGGNRTVVQSGLNFVDLNAQHLAYFGDAVLDDSMVPTALLWDITGTGIDVPLEDGEEVYDVSVAWYDLSKDQWFWGNLGRDKIDTGGHPDSDEFVDIETRMRVLAKALDYPGNAKDDAFSDITNFLGTDGRGNGEDAVPDDILALMQGNGAFFTDRVEDLRNTNYNFVLSVGDLPGGEFTLRVVPVYEQIVEDATTEYQFRVAGNLDGMANVPFLNLGNADEYKDEIDRINGLDEGERAESLERVSFSFLGAYSGLGMNLGREQVYAIGRPVFDFAAGGTALSTKGDGGWSMGDNLRGHLSAHGSTAEYDTTASGIGYDVRTLGLSAGIEAVSGANASFGLMVGALDGEAKAHAGRGKIEASGWSVAAYGRMAFGDGGTIQAIAGYQDLSFDSSRNAPGGAVARGKTDGKQTFLALQADYMFRQGALTWGPMASVERYRLKVDGFDESGAGAWDLSVGPQKGKITLASIGLRGDYAIDPASGTRAYGSLAYTHASGSDQLVSAGFIGLPGAALPVEGIDKNWADVTLGLSRTIPGERGRVTEFGGEYRGSFSGDYKSHGLGVFVKMRF